MSEMSDLISTTCYIQFVEAERWPEWASRAGVREIKAARITQERPRTPLPGAVVVKFRATLPRELFEPLVLESAVTVDAGRALQVVVEQEAVEDV